MCNKHFKEYFYAFKNKAYFNQISLFKGESGWEGSSVGIHLYKGVGCKYFYWGIGQGFIWVYLGEVWGHYPSF